MILKLFSELKRELVCMSIIYLLIDRNVFVAKTLHLFFDLICWDVQTHKNRHKAQLSPLALLTHMRSAFYRLRWPGSRRSSGHSSLLRGGDTEKGR